MKCSLIAAIALLSLMGCEQPTPTEVATPAPDLEGQDCPAPAACDVREQLCQQQVMKAMRCIRGGNEALPKISVMDVASLQRRLQSEAAPTAPRSMELLSRGLSLFKLAPTVYREPRGSAYLGNFAALYLPGTKEIVVIDNGEPLDTPEAARILAHEMVHAFQDAEYDLESYERQNGTTFDASLALAGLIEGEATLYDQLFSLRLSQIPERDFAWDHFFHTWQQRVLVEAQQGLNPLNEANLYFPYAFGGDFVTRHWLAGGRAAIERLFESPPRSTRAIMLHVDARADGFEQELQALLEQRGVPALPNTYRELGATTLGAWVARVFAAKQGLSDERGRELVGALAGDVFSIHYDPERDEVVAAWRVRMFGQDEGELWSALSSGPFTSGTEPDGRERFLIASEGAFDPPSMTSWRPREQAQDWLVALTHHEAAHPGLRDADLCVQHGPLALRYILAAGGSGYFRTRVVQPFLDSGQLYRVKKAPSFSYSAYAAYSVQSDAALVAWALTGLVQAAEKPSALEQKAPKRAAGTRLLIGAASIQLGK